MISIEQLREALKPKTNALGHEFDTSEYVVVNSGPRLVDSQEHELYKQAAATLLQIMEMLDKSEAVIPAKIINTKTDKRILLQASSYGGAIAHNALRKQLLDLINNPRQAALEGKG